MPNEKVFWTKGIRFDARSVLQAAGNLLTADNITFNKDGRQQLRSGFDKWESDELFGSPVHSVTAVPGGTRLILAEGTNLRRKP